MTSFRAFRYLALMAIISITAACGSNLPKKDLARKDCVGSNNPFCSSRASDYEAGSVYCGERYWIKHDSIDKKAIRLAGRGYLYVLAAAKSLHMPDQDGFDHEFADDPRLVHKPILDELKHWSGLQALVFEEYDQPGANLKNLVIAFRGSETREWVRDWLLQDFLLEIQNGPARSFVRKTLAPYRDKNPELKAVVAGFSLGGGLAAHISRHEETKDLIKEAWLFNPSPRDGVWWTEPRDNNFLIYQEGEILSGPRDWLNRLFDSSFAPDNQIASLEQIKAISVVDHYRWGLTLQILHAADVSHWCETRDWDNASPALNIIRRGHMAACDHKTAKKAVEIAEEAKTAALDREDPFSICP